MKTSFKFILDKEKILAELSSILNNKFSNTQKEDGKDGKSYRLKVSDLKNNILVIIYNTGSVVVQGKDCELKIKACGLLNDIEEHPYKYFEKETVSINDHVKRTTVYKIANKKLIDEIKENIEGYKEKQDLKTEKSSVIYRYKVKEGSLQITVTQYKNGTLFLQGKADKLWDKICETIEKLSSLSTEQVAGRFVSTNIKDAEYIVRIMTEELVQEAETDAETLLGTESLNYLDVWDKKYLVAGLALLGANLTYLPEFSCLIMPVAKAYEGFCTKLLIEIGLTSEDDTKKRGWNFGSIWSSGKYKDYISKNKFRKPKLDELKNKLDLNRNFNMHSSGASLIQVENIEKARETINSTCESIKDFHIFFIKNKGES